MMWTATRAPRSQGWQSSSGEDTIYAGKRATSLPPICDDEVMWTLVRRVAPGWRHLASDLYLLDAFEKEDNAEVISCTVALLKALGQRLLPTQARDLSRSRPEVTELAAMLATLAVRPPHARQGKDADKIPERTSIAENTVTVEKVVDAPKVVDKIAEKVVQVPMEKMAEAKEEVPSEKSVKNITQVSEEKIVERIEEATAQKDACSIEKTKAIDNDEKPLTGDESLRLEFNLRFAAHSEKHPGGKLPTELRSFDAYKMFVSGTPGHRCRLGT